MKKIFYPLVAGVLLFTSAFISTVSTDWKINPGFSIKFISKDPSGIFKEFTGTIKFDETDLATSKFDLSIPVSSISTGNGMMNKKSQIEEWFNAAKFPTITFVSTKIEKSTTGYSISGNLKMKGTSKAVKIPVVYTHSGETAKFTGTFNVKRSDYKIGHTSDAVPDIMKIEFSVPVSKK